MIGKSIYLLLFQDDEQWRVNKIEINVDQVQEVTNWGVSKLKMFRKISFGN
jgi:hypothetical protein